MLGIDELKRATAATGPYATGNLGALVLAAMPGRTRPEPVDVVGIVNESAFCCAGGGIGFDDAVEHVLSLAPSRFRAEAVPLVDCACRVIAKPFEARLDLPGFDRSAMDGYAVSCADLKTGAWLPTIGRTAAGEAPGRLCPNSAHRIMTGAPLPDRADAVIAQENVHQRGSMLQIGAVPPVGSNVRRRGHPHWTNAHRRRGHAGLASYRCARGARCAVRFGAAAPPSYTAVERSRASRPRRVSRTRPDP